MFGLKSYAFDLFFTKRPAAVFTKSGKVFSISGICNAAIAECELRSLIRLRRTAGVIPREIRQCLETTKRRSLAGPFNSQLKPIRAHFPFTWTRSRVLMKRAG